MAGGVKLPRRLGSHDRSMAEVEQAPPPPRSGFRCEVDTDLDPEAEIQGNLRHIEDDQLGSAIRNSAAAPSKTQASTRSVESCAWT